MKLGIALGGGGAKGYAHIGILQVLLENGIEFEIVAGTSIGALVGAAYAANALEDLVATSSGIRLTDIPRLLGPTVSKTGMFSGKSVQAMLGEIVQYENIEQLPRQFAAVSADLATNKPVVFTDGLISDAVRASISIPALFTPVIKDSCFLVDGGLVDPVPIEVCHTLGATQVLAVDLFGNQSPSPADLGSTSAALWPKGLSTALSYLDSVSNKLKLPTVFGDSTSDKARNRLPSSAPGNIVEVMEATLSLSQKLLTESRLREHPANLVLQPAVRDVGFLDFHRGEPTIEIGRKCALEALPQIRAMVKERP